VGECGSPTHFNCLKASKDMMEFNTETAVCGSDGLVYQSEDHLYCATLEDKCKNRQCCSPIIYRGAGNSGSVKTRELVTLSLCL
jgi:hypothetical protein